MPAFARTFRAEDFVPPLALLPPLAPHSYAALRRKAAGLSIEQAAKRLAPDPASTGIAADLLRQLEMPGAYAKFCHTQEHLRAAFPFDPAVYRLLKHGSLDRHPAICRSCGCTATDDVEPGGDAVRMVSDRSCALCDEAERTGTAR